jgi:hypothetical protein
MWFVRTQKALYLTLLYKFALRMLLSPRCLTSLSIIYTLVYQFVRNSFPISSVLSSPH